MSKHLSKERKHFGCHPGSCLDCKSHTLLRGTSPPPSPQGQQLESKGNNRESVQDFRASKRILFALFRQTVSIHHAPVECIYNSNC